MKQDMKDLFSNKIYRIKKLRQRYYHKFVLNINCKLFGLN